MIHRFYFKTSSLAPVPLPSHHPDTARAMEHSGYARTCNCISLTTAHRHGIEQTISFHFMFLEFFTKSGF